MKDYQTGAVRDTGGKGRMDLLPMCALIRISKHMEDAILPDPDTGKPHYPERNWEKGLPIHTMIDSAMRHIAKYVDGQVDEDHLCAAATNLLMALWIEEKRWDMVDIPAVRENHPEKEPTCQPCSKDWCDIDFDDDLNMAAKRAKYLSRPEDHPDTRNNHNGE